MLTVGPDIFTKHHSETHFAQCGRAVEDGDRSVTDGGCIRLVLRSLSFQNDNGPQLLAYFEDGIQKPQIVGVKV